MKQQPQAFSDFINDNISWTLFMINRKWLFIIFILLISMTDIIGWQYNVYSFDDYTIDLLVGTSSLVGSFILSVAVYYSTWKSEMVLQKANRPRVVFEREIDINSGRLRNYPKENALKSIMDDDFSFFNISIMNCGNHNLHGLHLNAVYRSKNNRFLGKENLWLNTVDYYDTIGFHESFQGEGSIYNKCFEGLRAEEDIDFTCEYTVSDDLLNNYLILHRFSYGPMSWGDCGTVVLTEKEALKYYGYMSKLTEGDKMLYMYRLYHQKN